MDNTPEFSKWLAANDPEFEFSQADGVTLAEASDRIPVYMPDRRVSQAGRQSELTQSLTDALRGDVNDWKHLAQHWKRRAEINAMLLKNVPNREMDSFLVGLFWGGVIGLAVAFVWRLV